MGLFERFPYTNFHELNAEWLLKKMKELAEAMKTFKATESLKFADPIIWDITTQYQKSTIVLDPTGNAYLSVQPVPAGVQLNNDEYWLEIFNFTDYIRTANKNLTVHVETNTTRATAAYNVDDWLIWEDVLYRVTAAIAIDDALVIGTNLVHFTVEDFIKAFITYVTGLIQQYKNDIDASEIAYRNQLAQDIANTTAALTAQFNAAIAGVTVDSEVIDARVGYNGITYSTLGAAIRTQVGDLANVSQEFDETLQNILLTSGLINYLPSYMITDAQIAFNGAISDYANYNVEVFKVTPGTTVIANSGYVYALYSSRPFRGTANSYNSSRVVGAISNTKITIPAGVEYLAIRYEPLNDPTPTVMYPVVSIPDAFNELAYANDIDISSGAAIRHDGYFISRVTRVPTANVDFFYTDPIKVNAGDIVKFDGRGYLDAVAMISLTDANGTYYDPVVISEDNIAHTFYYMAQAEGYVALSSNKTGVDLRCIIFGLANNNLLNTIVNKIMPINPLLQNDKLDNYTEMFHSIGVIGDSLADGVFVAANGNFADRSYSWPQIIARKYGITVTNYTRGGLTTRTALSDFVNPPSFTHNPSIAYIIGLGVNDRYYWSISDPEGVALGSPSDIDLNNRALCADTYYGNYASIIMRIKEVQPKAKIFCITRPAEVSETDGYNAAIRYMASIFTDVYIIDLYNYGMDIFYSTMESDPNLWYGSHGTALLYEIAARHITSFIDYIVKNNQSNFKDTQFIGTNYHY